MATVTLYRLTAHDQTCIVVTWPWQAHMIGRKIIRVPMSNIHVLLSICHDWGRLQYRNPQTGWLDLSLALSSAIELFRDTTVATGIECFSAITIHATIATTIATKWRIKTNKQKTIQIFIEQIEAIARSSDLFAALLKRGGWFNDLVLPRLMWPVPIFKLKLWRACINL